MLIVGTIASMAGTVLSAFFYRLGGMSQEEADKKLPWVPDALVDGWVRDFFCTALVAAWAVFFLPRTNWWLYVISFGLMYGAMTTYWDEVPWNKGRDNFWMHGFFIGLALFPMTIGTGMWLGFGIRCMVLALGMGTLCAIASDVDVEEYGRGALIMATMPLMLI